MEKEELIKRLTRTEYRVITFALQDHKAIALLMLIDKELENLKAEGKELGRQMQFESIRETIESGIKKAFE
jgi:hypothetical protein